jgi:large subunit ribosomal protein L29
MAIIRKNELASMDVETLNKRLFELRKELNSERGLIASGGRSQNPGKIKELKRTIARILTLISQKEKGLTQDKKKDSKQQSKQAAPPKTEGGKN